MRVTTTAKLEFLSRPPALTATVQLPDGALKKLALQNPKWTGPSDLQALHGKTYKLQGEVTLGENKDPLAAPGTEGVFVIQRMKRAAFAPR
jgi:hypothetical protein